MNYNCTLLSKPASMLLILDLLGYFYSVFLMVVIEGLPTALPVHFKITTMYALKHKIERGYGSALKVKKKHFKKIEFVLWTYK